jgi:hypothetical protein
MMTTITFLIGTVCAVGVGVGVGESAVEGDEPFTPPQPTIRARNRGLKKNKNTRLKVLTPLSVFETNWPSKVGLTMYGFEPNINA